METQVLQIFFLIKTGRVRWKGTNLAVVVLDNKLTKMFSITIYW